MCHASKRGGDAAHASARALGGAHFSQTGCVSLGVTSRSVCPQRPRPQRQRRCPSCPAADSPPERQTERRREAATRTRTERQRKRQQSTTSEQQLQPSTRANNRRSVGSGAATKVLSRRLDCLQLQAATDPRHVREISESDEERDECKICQQRADHKCRRPDERLGAPRPARPAEGAADQIRNAVAHAQSQQGHDACVSETRS